VTLDRENARAGSVSLDAQSADAAATAPALEQNAATSAPYSALSSSVISLTEDFASPNSIAVLSA
jgi:hypothetical protein